MRSNPPLSATTAPQANYAGPAILASGHRVFFLAAAGWASAAMGLWLIALHGSLSLTPAWHGHEMLFGFAVAAVAGFLLTAVPNWTGSEPVRGWPLLALLCLWLLGRLSMLVGVATWLDLLFLPALAAVIGAAIVRARNTRNYLMPAMLIALAVLNLAFFVGETTRALWATTLVLAAMIALIGGRIVPLFTRNALRASGWPAIDCPTPATLQRLAVPSVLAVVATEIAWQASAARGIAAMIAGVVLILGMLRWQTMRTFRMPIVWVLHAGYVWVPIGLLLLALADIGGDLAPTVALHALTANAIGIMILAVASRAALGHSGRPLITPPLTVAAYGLVIVGGLLRVLFPVGAGMIASGVLWMLGYGVFLIDYWPILTRPRIDGRPG